MMEIIIAFILTAWAGIFAYLSSQMVIGKKVKRKYRDQVIEKVADKFVLKDK